MATETDFSVIITSYNYRDFIFETIDSALAQTLAPREVLIVDDGSTDTTVADVTKRYAMDFRVRVIATENRGQLAAFAEGVQQASAPVVAFLDADDLWESNYLQRIAAIYDTSPQIDFVYTNMRFFGDRQGTLLKETRSHDLGLSILQGAYCSSWQGAATSAISIKRQLARKLLLDVPVSVQSQWRTRADDFLTFGADILGARKYYLAESLVRYRAHGANSWLNQKKDAAATLRYQLKLEQLIEFYLVRTALNPVNRAKHLRYVKHEFRSKPNPTFDELKIYLGMLKQSSLPWNRRLEHYISMWWHYWKSQRRNQPQA